MKKMKRIITVGLCPCWDVTCGVAGLEWGQHKQIIEQSARPAGKALNICRGLHWMGRDSIAAGLWGQGDYPAVIEALAPLAKRLRTAFTVVPGHTRQNITIIDTSRKAREIHLRAPSKLASRQALRQVQANLKKIITADSVCVFAGAMPGDDLLAEVIETAGIARRRGARLAIDTSGPALKALVKGEPVWLIKPNVAELGELMGQPILDRRRELIQAGRKLLSQVEIVLITRGPKGALVVTPGGAWHGRTIRQKKPRSTVGCGDYFLAAFLNSITRQNDPARALQMALKAAAARAWGLTEQTTWLKTQRTIEVNIRKVSP